MERPYLWSTYVWNMFDFGCAARNEGGTAGRNNKGLVTLDRKIKKDAFYLYKAYWSSEPFVHICGRRFAQRTDFPAGSGTITLRIYSNQPEVSLYCNGDLFLTLTGSHVFVFEQVPLKDGFTCFTACAGDCSDTISLQRADEKPAVYTLPPEEEEDTDGAANWFDEAAATEANAPMEFPEGRFSVKDPVRDILRQEEAARILTGALSSLTGMKLKKGMLGMLGEKTAEELVDMMGSMGMGGTIPEGAARIINAELNKIPKKG